MTPEKLDLLRQYLPHAGLIALASCACFYLGLHKGLLPALAFTPARDIREPPLWRGTDVVLALAAWFLAGLVAAGLSALAHSGGNLNEVQILAGTLLPNLAALAVIALAVRRRLGQPWAVLGLAPAPARNLIAVVATYLLFLPPLYFAASLWHLLLARFGHQASAQELVDIYRNAIGAEDAPMVATLWVTAILVAPFCEEVIYRGFFFGLLRERTGPGIAALISSTVFAAVHTSLSGLLPIFLLACVLCYVYHRTRSLYPAMLFHAVFNGVMLLAATTVDP